MGEKAKKRTARSKRYKDPIEAVLERLNAQDQFDYMVDVGKGVFSGVRSYVGVSVRDKHSGKESKASRRGNFSKAEARGIAAELIEELVTKLRGNK
ncbi:MAG: hypothetical protein P1V97_10455 [Planctomycetota bacterium]|nr:hypothetical protein [Planctomycetota bacterium]